MIHLHLWCFQSTVVWQESANSFTRLAFRHKQYLKKESFRSRSQVIGITQVCFGLLKSSRFCLRGSRAVYRKTAEFEIDVDVSHTVTRI